MIRQLNEIIHHCEQAMKHTDGKAREMVPIMKKNDALNIEIQEEIANGQKRRLMLLHHLVKLHRLSCYWLSH